MLVSVLKEVGGIPEAWTLPQYTNAGGEREDMVLAVSSHFRRVTQLF